MTLTEAEPRLELNLWDFSTEPDDCVLDLTLSLKPSFSGTGAWILSCEVQEILVTFHLAGRGMLFHIAIFRIADLGKHVPRRTEEVRNY
jgi:hypothetical protein